MPLRRSRAFLAPAPEPTDIPPGPNAGRVWLDAVREWRDPISGCVIRQITSYRGHSRPASAANPNSPPNRDSLLITSDRNGYSNLFEYDFRLQRLTQLTDLRGEERPSEIRLCDTLHLEFRYGEDLCRLEFSTLRLRIERGRTSLQPHRWLALTWLPSAKPNYLMDAGHSG